MMWIHLTRPLCLITLIMLSNIGESATPQVSPAVKNKAATKSRLPPYLAAGTQWGVMSPTPWVNQQVAHWLKQKGTVWDGALAALSELLVKEPKIVSFHSDIALLYATQNHAPQFMWMGHHLPVNASTQTIFESSSWANVFITEHRKQSKYPVEQITSLAQQQATPAIRKVLQSLSTQKPLKPTHITSSHTLQISGSHLYAIDVLFLGSVQATLDALWPHPKLDTTTLATYLQKTKFPRLTPAYTSTWGMVVFDRYGSVLALNVGIPRVQSAKPHPYTHTLVPTDLSNLQARQWSLSPVAAHQKNQLQWVVIAHNSKPLDFFQGFPAHLFRYLKLNHSWVDTLDKPPGRLPLSGFEVWPTTVVGFTPHTGKVKPLME